MKLGRADAGTVRRLDVGDEVTIRLAENPSTGYRWTVTNSAPAVLAPLEDRIVSSSGKPGAAAERELGYTATAPGIATLELVQRRAWESPAAALDRFAVTIEVTGPS